MTDNRLSDALGKIQEREESLLLNGLVRATKAYQETPTVSTLREFTAAKQAVADYNARKAAEENPEQQKFTNLLEVTAYLRDSGWKAGKTKIYEDQNKIDRQADGSILRKDADRYARTFLRKMDGTDANGLTGEEERLSAEKLRYEIEISKEKAEKLRRENAVQRGLYILRSRHSSDLAARLAFLLGELGANFMHSRAAQIIDIVEGKRDKAPELVAWWAEETAAAFDYYSRPAQFEAPMPGEAEDSEEEAAEEAVEEHGESP